MVEYLGTGNKAQHRVCLLFSTCSLSHRYYTRLSFHQQSTCVYAYPRVKGVHECVRVGGDAFELCKGSTNEKETKFNYQLITS